MRNSTSPRGALAVAGDLASERCADVGQGAGEGGSSGLPMLVARRPRREHEHGVVRAHVAIDADAVETPLDRGAERPVETRGVDCRVGRDHGEHGRHLRWIMPAPFAKPAMRIALRPSGTSTLAAFTACPW